jgi:hypothetical protein
LAQLSFQANIKVIISFYQIACTLDTVYGVQVPDQFRGWLSFMDVINLDVLDLTLPSTCLGSMTLRLIFSATWPYVLTLMVVGIMSLYAVLRRAPLKPSSDQGTAPLLKLLRQRALYAVILVFYLVLPTVSRSLFRARQCEAFAHADSGNYTSRSYLLADMRIHCNDGGDEWNSEGFSRLQPFFWSFFVLWPVLVPLTYFGLLLAIRPAVRAQRVSALALACSFLWRDYDPAFLFWEVLDLARKLFLTPFVLFIDTASSTNRILRIIIGGVVSGTYLALLMFAQPYKRFDDLKLAAFSNLLLMFICAMSIITKLCDDSDNSCSLLIGLAGPDGAALLVVLLTISLLVVSAAVIAFQVANAASAPRIKLASTRRAPVLDLPVDCQFHCFLSHVWDSGQDTTHTIARKMQLLLPEMQIWLDVDHLQNISKLVEEIAKAAMLVIFASKGYFKSKNCRRELYAALHQKKPIVLIIDPEKSSSLEKLRQEWREWCVAVGPPEYPAFSGPSEAVAAVFDREEPVVWSRIHEFQLASLKTAVLRILRRLPYYTAHDAELEGGVFATSQIRPQSFRRPVRILTCTSNKGAHLIAKELAAAACHPGSASVEVAEVLLEQSLEEFTTNGPTRHVRVVLLLYLNKQTFVGNDGVETAMALRHLYDSKVFVVLVQETDASAGGCPFSTFIEVAPKDLQVAPYKLFGQIAVALFSTPEFRSVSLRLLLRYLGATLLRSQRCVWRMPPWKLFRLAFAQWARAETGQAVEMKCQGPTASEASQALAV